MRLKAAWIVKAGVIPGKAENSYTKQFTYTSEECEKDDEIDKFFKSGDIYEHMKGFAIHSEFSKTRAIALDYYMQISNPRINNWATIEFIWY